MLIDESLLQFEEISMGSGQYNTGVILKRNDLLKILPEAQIGKFVVDL
jgi:prolyl-tRNA editing enzyme YbaK/EbsC (Cys-tRNA(Pro) deacylase)